MQIIPANLDLDFIGKRKLAAVFSGVILATAIGLVFFGKGLNFGIDFTGGVENQIKFDRPVPIGDVRAALDGQDIKISVQSFGESDQLEYLIRAPLVDDMAAKEESNKIRDVLNAEFGEYGVQILRTEVVGPKVGQELREQGLLSIFFALGGILLYVWLRFQLQYAVGAIVALVHDVTIVVGVFSLAGLEINLPTIAALLTIIGYSLNDTVVVFDRIRENRNRNRRAEFAPVINRSINETLSRTILTSMTTLFTVLALLFLTQAGSVIHNFAFALLAGILVGTYSSVFVASPVLLLWENRSK